MAAENLVPIPPMLQPEGARKALNSDLVEVIAAKSKQLQALLLCTSVATESDCQPSEKTLQNVLWLAITLAEEIERAVLDIDLRAEEVGHGAH